MHELSICNAIAETVTDHAGPRRVAAAHVRIGHLRQVVPETLVFCWELHTEGGPLDGADLVVDYVPAVIECRSCGTRTELDDPLLLCGTCDGADVELITGEEFEIRSIDLHPVESAEGVR